MRNRQQDNPQQEPESEPVVPEPIEHPQVLSGDEDWKQAVEKLDQALTKRINDLNTSFRELDNSISTKLTTVNSDIKTLKTKTENNSETLRSYSSTIDSVRKSVSEAKKQAAQLHTDMEAMKEFQGNLNTAFSRGIDDAKQAAQDALAQAHAEIQQVARAVNASLNALRSEYQQHTHTFQLTGDTGTPKGGGTQ